MVATLEVRPAERVPLAFVIAVEIGHAQHGTREHQEIGLGLRRLYTDLMDAPDGPVALQFENDELYQIGIRLVADSSELEQWWLDHRASMRAIREAALFPDDNFGRAVQRFFPEALEQPETWEFEPLHGIYIGLGHTIDDVLRDAHPQGRALYTKERTEITRRTRRMQEDRAARRARRYPRGLGRDLWRRAVRADQLGVGDMTAIDIEGRQVLVANTGDGFYALDAVCTHVPTLAAIANLSNGQLDSAAGCVTCPWHGAQFDLRTGRVVRSPYAPEFNRQHLFAGRITSLLDPKKTATDTRVYPTKVEGAYVLVNIG